MDMSKLTPAPWMPLFADWQPPRVVCESNEVGAIITGDVVQGEQWAEFIALARNAFDVMLRRGWCAVPTLQVDESLGPWCVRSRTELLTRLMTLRWPDPFTALVEADKWYAENVENAEKIPKDVRL